MLGIFKRHISNINVIIAIYLTYNQAFSNVHLHIQNQLNSVKLRPLAVKVYIIRIHVCLTDVWDSFNLKLHQSCLLLFYIRNTFALICIR